MSCDNECVEIAKQCLKDEATAIMQQINYIDQHFVKACDIILQCKGKVIVTGVGKSGHIGAKIAATLASTGTPSFFSQPVGRISRRFGRMHRGRRGHCDIQ
jgi:arabinose-5-phosphate isomerase